MTDSPNATTPAVDPKVVAATIGGAASTILIYLIETLAHTDLPGGIEVSVTTLVVFLFGYLKSN